MYKLVNFTSGLFLGGIITGAGCFFVLNEKEVSAQGNNFDAQTTELNQRPLDAIPPCAVNETSGVALISRNNDDQSPNVRDFEKMLSTLLQHSSNQSTSNEYQDLTYWVRHSPRAAATIRKRIESTRSIDEKLTLIRILSHSDSQETFDFASSLIQSLDRTNQRLGFNLLASLGDKADTPELHAALIDASYYETDPEALTNIIYRLSAANMDETEKENAIQSLENLLPSDNTQVTARAIDGLSKLGDKTVIYSAIRSNLSSQNQSVKLAAISALHSFEKAEVGQDIVDSLNRIANDENESAIAREYAENVLKDL